MRVPVHSISWSPDVRHSRVNIKPTKTKARMTNLSVLCQPAEIVMSSVLSAIFIAATTVAGNMPLGEMEEAFWNCDFTATHDYIDPDVAAGCSEIYERLKIQKFDGDFKRLLVWWQENKDREFAIRRKLAQQRRSQ
jgi:hypothetical protein